VPDPERVLGYEPGTAGEIPSWSQVVDYFTRLDAASPRVTVRTLGQTTLGRPLIAAFISDSLTLRDLGRYREIQRRLADPRLWEAGERQRLIAGAKVVAFVTASIHPNEVGATLTPLGLAHRLATGEDEEARAIRANTITVVVPSLNPDGVDVVYDWHRSTLGTPLEGTSSPWLYHKYVGHDLNRDWYAFTQVETRLAVDSLHNVWHPVAVNDIHQSSSHAMRMFVPPYADPVEPNVDPLLVEGIGRLGPAMVRRLLAEGKQGIATGAMFDAWTPGRVYEHSHGGMSILTETAMARNAFPLRIPFKSLTPYLGVDPRVESPHFPVVWRGGRWTLADVVDYQSSAAWAFLAELARGRDAWLEQFARVGERAVAGRAAPGRESWPAAFVIPAAQRDQAALAMLLRVLQRGQVELRRTERAFVTDGVRHPAGSYVVLTAQPYGAFAKALLERQRYPGLRDPATGRLSKIVYDAAAHSLALLAGVQVHAIADSLPVPTSEPVPPVPAAALVAEGLTANPARRIALYRGYPDGMDEGWTRWLFDQYRIPYVRVDARDVRAGALRDRFDVLVIPDQQPRELAYGVQNRALPDSLKGGLGRAGAARLGEFVDGGGTVVALDMASLYAIPALRLPVRAVTPKGDLNQFYAPGSLLTVDLNREHPMAARMPAEVAVMSRTSPTFEVLDTGRVAVVASYPTDRELLLSGWLNGGEWIAGKAALVEVRRGRGRVVLFGFAPHYRGQSMATYPLLWGALRARE